MLGESKITYFKNSDFIYSNNSFFEGEKDKSDLELFREQKKERFLIFICEHQNIDVL